MAFPRLSVIALLVFLLTAVSCSGDRREDFFGFNLRINNGTDLEYNIYQASTFSGGAFTMVGTVSPSQTRTIRRLVIDVNYTFRLVRDDDVEKPDFEQIIRSSGENVSWSVP